MTGYKRKYKVVAIEPSPLVQAGLKALFAPSPEFELSAVYPDLYRLNEPGPGDDPDLVILNPIVVDYHKRTGIRTLIPASSSVPLIALLYHYTDADILKQFDGTIDINDDNARIVRKLRQAMESHRNDTGVSESYDLSDREKEILVSVAKGMTNKEIADRHNISVHTVISHRKNISRKTGIKSVSGLTVYALLNNLLDQADIE